MRSPSVALVILLSLATSQRPVAQQADTFTATAALNGAHGQSIPVTFVVTHYTTEAERARMSAALKQGAASLHALFKTMPDVGRIEVNSRTIPLKYAYRRPANGGRTIALVADVPLAFLDSGTAADKSKEGFDFTLASLDFSLPGFAAGELDPAVKLGVNSAGLIVTQEYGAAVVRLAEVREQ
jgi:hypothetical protein